VHGATPSPAWCRISWSDASPVKSPGTMLVGPGRGRDAGTQRQRSGMDRHPQAALCHKPESDPQPKIVIIVERSTMRTPRRRRADLALRPAQLGSHGGTNTWVSGP
jgi:hypothetical protein